MRKYQKYIEKYNSRIILMGLFVFLFHGAKLFSHNVGIDTEDLIHLEGDFYNGWLSTGRQGLVFLKTLFGSLWFNPYFAGLMTLLFLGLAGMAFFFLWESCAEKKRSPEEKDSMAGWFFGGLLLFSHPVLTEQLYFSLQGVEICLGISLTAAALYFTGRWVRSRSIAAFLAGVLLLTLTFSTYQSFVPLYIFGTVTVLLLKGLEAEEEGAFAGLIRQLLSYVAVFFAAFLVNTVITGLFFSGSSYLQGQILWGQVPFTDALRAIAGHVVKAFTGYDSIYYSLGYGLLCLAAMVLFFRLLGRMRCGKKEKVLFAFFLAALLFTPFLMTVVCGGAPAIRSQLVLPLITGFFGWFVVYLKKRLDVKADGDEKEKSLKSRAGLSEKLQAAGWLAVLLICLGTGLGQLQTTMRLYYTDDVRYEQDASLGRALIERIEQVRGKDWLPVVFIGKREFQGNNACLEGETIGKSFFAYDTDVEPDFYWSSRRILGFFHTLGQSYELIGPERIPEAMEYSTYMPEWPAENSVQIHEGMIVVKLSHFE